MSGGGVVGHADGPRSMRADPRGRRRCHCGCGGRATHVGMGTNRVVLMGGCEFRVRLWVRDGYSPEFLGWTLGEDGNYHKGDRIVRVDRQGES